MWCGIAEVPLRKADNSDPAETLTMTTRAKDGKLLTHVFAPDTMLPQSAILKQDSVVRLTLHNLPRASLARVLARLHDRQVSVSTMRSAEPVSGEFDGTLSEIAAHFALDVVAP